MHLVRAKSRGYNTPGFWSSDNLRFLSVPLFLAAVRVFPLFWGRSTGHSVASTTTTSKIKSLLVKAFFAWQRECTGAQQGILDRMNGAADGGLAQAVSVSKVGVSAVLTPVHQIRAKTSRSSKAGFAGNAWAGVRRWADARQGPKTWRKMCPAKRWSAACTRAASAKRRRRKIHTQDTTLT